MNVKMFIWVYLVLTKVTGATSVFTTSELPSTERTWPAVEKLAYSVSWRMLDVKNGLSSILTAQTNSCFCAKEMCTTKTFFDNVKEFTAKNSVKIALVATDVVLIGTSVHSLISGRLAYWKMAYLAATLTASLFSSEDNPCSTASVMDNTILCKMYCYLYNRKEENFLLPPAEDPPINKLSKQLFPGIDVMYPLVSLKAILKAVINEYMGLTVLQFSCGLIFASLITSLLVLSLLDRPEEKYQEEKFTAEELLEEYDDMPEFRQTLEAWLTPRRVREGENRDQFSNYKD